jgi:diguanylate cyclase (GGDEF)-like protein
VPITAPEHAPPATPSEEIKQPAPEPALERAPTGATFIQMLKRRVTESHRFGVPLSLMCLKIQDYDLVGRKYGPKVAMQMVDKLAPTVEKLLREMDVLVKLENGEFVLMLPGNTQFEAARVAKRIYAATDESTLTILGQEMKLQLLDGIAELKAGETAQELLGRARHSVAAAKLASRSATA